MANKDYAYINAPVSAIELNTNKVTEISDEQTYTDEKYASVEAIKDYVSEHSGGGGADCEKIANKATVIDDTADNTKYPTTLAVKNAVEAIPASPATRIALRINIADVQDISYVRVTPQDPDHEYAVGMDFNLPVGTFENDEYIPKTNPIIYADYYAVQNEYKVSSFVSFSKVKIFGKYNGVDTIFNIDEVIYAHSGEIENINGTAMLELRFVIYTNSDEESEQVLYAIQQGIITFDYTKMLYETFVEKNLEFEE